MKRFLLDGLLVLVLVGIGSAVMKEKPVDDHVIDVKIEEFENEVAKQSTIKPKSEGFRLNQIKQNKAGELAKGTSETIVAIVDTTVEIIASLFAGVTE